VNYCNTSVENGVRFDKCIVNQSICVTHKPGVAQYHHKPVSLFVAWFMHVPITECHSLHGSCQLPIFIY